MRAGVIAGAIWNASGNLKPGSGARQPWDFFPWLAPKEQPITPEDERKSLEMLRQMFGGKVTTIHERGEGGE